MQILNILLCLYYNSNLLDRMIVILDQNILLIIAGLVFVIIGLLCSFFTKKIIEGKTLNIKIVDFHENIIISCMIVGSIIFLFRHGILPKTERSYMIYGFAIYGTIAYMVFSIVINFVYVILKLRSLVTRKFKKNN